MNIELASCIARLILDGEARNINDFAEKVGCRASYVSDVKAGRRPMTPRLAHRISQAFPTYSVDYFMGEQSNPPTDLTWQDIKRIVNIADDLLEANPHPASEEEYYTRVLEEFNLQHTKG